MADHQGLELKTRTKEKKPIFITRMIGVRDQDSVFINEYCHGLLK